MRGDTAVAKLLKAEGVEYLFCFPNNSLIEAAASEGIRPIIARSEKALLNMADGYTRVSNRRRIAAVAVQQGPGVENAFGGVAQAFSDSVPILFLPGGPAQNRLGTPTGFDPIPSYQHITKWAARINQPERIGELLRRAFTQLRCGVGAPVLLELPMDVASAEVDERAVAAYRVVRPIRSAGDPEDVAALARALIEAKSPMLHVGHGVLWAEAWDELRELAELLQVPVMTTMAAKGAFPEDHPLSIGTGGLTYTAGIAHFLGRADLILGVGCSFSRGSFSTTLPAGKRMMQITAGERDVNKDYPIELAVIGDAQLVLRQLLAELRGLGMGVSGSRGEVAAEVKALKDAFFAEWMPRLTSAETPINPYRVVWDLAQTVDRRMTIATHDAGNPRDQMLTFYEALTPRGYLGWGKSTQLGTSLGLAMGAKLAAPDHLVVNVLGDLAFGMAGMDVETAARERIAIMTIILNNSCMGGYGHHMPVASERYRSNLLSGSYRTVAEGLGAYAERVDRPEEIVPAIRRGIATTREGRPVVLEVITKEEPVFPRGPAR